MLKTNSTRSFVLVFRSPKNDACKEMQYNPQKLKTTAGPENDFKTLNVKMLKTSSKLSFVLVFRSPKNYACKELQYNPQKLKTAAST